MRRDGETIRYAGDRLATAVEAAREPTAVPDMMYTEPAGRVGAATGKPDGGVGESVGDSEWRPSMRGAWTPGDAMPRFGITGHVNLTLGTAPLVYEALRAALTPYAAALTGVSCIAEGADAIFAQAVLDLGGCLEVVIPSRDYRARTRPGYTPVYDELLRRAESVRVLPYAEAGRDAYEAANHAMVNARLDRLFAVWDGAVDDGKGNTASVVTYARGMPDPVPVQIVWPAGAARIRCG